MTARVSPHDEAFQRKLFRDKKFISRLNHVARHKNVEAGFLIEVHPTSGMYYISHVVSGNSDSMSFEKAEDPSYPAGLLEGGIEYFNFHSHGNFPVIMPSISPDGDFKSSYYLEDFFKGTGLDVRIIQGITRYTPDAKKPVLIVQRKIALPSHEVFGHVSEELERKVREVRTDIGVVEILNNSELYRAYLVYHDRNGFDKESLKKLTRFAETPQVIDQKAFDYYYDI